jgi:amino acid adenylation domain-containing protein
MNVNFAREVSFDGNQYTKEREYWLNKLSGELVKKSFPYDRDIMGGNGRKIKQQDVDCLTFRFPRKLFSKLLNVINGSDVRLHMILVAGLVILLHKYTGEKDIILGTAIDRQEDEGIFINTVLTLRNQLEDNMTFKELLYQVRETIIGASQHLNYPIENLIIDLNMSWDADEFPLFDTAILLENIHDKRYINHLNLNMIFSFSRTGEYIEGRVEYNTSLYHETTIKRIIDHYIHILRVVLANVDLKISRLEILSKEEQKQLLYDFNNTKTGYPKNKVIHELFREQAEKTPARIALECEDRRLTYRQLDEKTDRLAAGLEEKGVRIGTIVGLMLERSVEMIVGILGILKAGGAYIPIDPENPDDRIKFILMDSRTDVLLTQENLQTHKEHILKHLPLTTIIPVEDEAIYAGKPGPPETGCTPMDPVYIIYTSGTTGRSKGVLVNHLGVVNYIWFAAKNYVKNERAHFPLFTSFSFDMTVTSIFTPLLTGNTLVVYGPQYDDMVVEKIVDDNKVTIVKLTPSHLKLLKYKEITGSEIKRFILGGEVLETQLAEDTCENFARDIEIYNEYGPTEATVGCTICKFEAKKEKRKTVSIGTPVDNTQIYILDAYLIPVPVSAVGEIYVSGDGVARGYLNRPELTHEKFTRNSFIRGERLYKTGDLGRWMPGGKIEFLGRKDNQIKIRGYRIEPGEIEYDLLKHDNIKAALVTPVEIIAGKIHAAFPGFTGWQEVERSDNALCAYIVPDAEVSFSHLREYLSDKLPQYMVPSYFVTLETIPLTPNGKVDMKALPAPEIKAEAEYSPPGNKIEKMMVKIWMEILDIDQEKIGIDANYFELGGHSLNATVLVSKIHKEFNVKVPLMEVFRTPTIRDLAKYAAEAEKEIFIAIEPAEKREYYLLSSAQKRLYILQQIEASGNISYNIPLIFELPGKLDRERLEKTFKILIQRHENFRTSFALVNDETVQKIYPDVDFKIEYYEDKEHVHKIIDHFIRPFDLKQAPLLRAGLNKIEENKQVLMVDMHHIISDGVSMDITIKDFMALYRGQDLPGIRIQYKDFSQWQNRLFNSGVIDRQEKYWLEQFKGDIPVLDLPVDFPRPAVQRFEGSTLGFIIGEAPTKSLKTLIKQEDITMFMLMTAVYNVFLSKLSGQEDIVVGFPIAGRRHADLEGTIGMFVNMIALRSYPRGDKSFIRYVREIKESTLESFENQDYQFENLVEKAAVRRDMSRNPLFDVIFALEKINREIRIEDVPGEDSRLKEKKYDYEHRISKFDLSLYSDEAENILTFRFEYSTNLFQRETMKRFVRYFKQLVSSVIHHTGENISELEIIPEEMKKQVLFDFNRTETAYPRHKTICRLFEDQVETNPDHIAVLGAGPADMMPGTGEGDGDHLLPGGRRCVLTYKELKKKSRQLARQLRAKGVKPGSIVGIMVGRSLEMMVGILGILEAGGAYLPLDPDFPGERLVYMLADSDARALVSTRPLAEQGEKVRRWEGKKIFLETSPVPSVSPLVENINPHPSPPVNTPATSLAYVIYTSGSTGKPKGVMIENSAVVNFIKGITDIIAFGPGDRVLSLTTISFDIFALETILPLTKGAKAIIGDKEEQLNAAAVSAIIEREIITIFQVTPSRLLLLTSDPEGVKGLTLLKYLLVGGEAFPGALLEKVRNFVGGKIFNLYGPTETTVWSTVKEVSAGKTLNIGQPIANTGIYMISGSGSIQPVGVFGELCIAGDGLSMGYINRPSLTAEKFIRCRVVHGTPRIRIYRTGDLARWLPDGNIEFLGRIDLQVKIRGFRIELGEIENRLQAHRDIQEVAVIVSGSEDDRLLCAYIVSDNTLDVTGMREYLSEKLPYYMIPSFFIRLEKMPLTPSGKIDRKALPAPGTAAESNECVPPRDEVEEILAGIWSEVLVMEKEKIGVNYNFFEWGGHSLRATIMLSKIHKKLNVKVPLGEVFKTPNIRDLSTYIKGAAQSAFTSIEPVEKKDYYPLSSAQKRLFFLHQVEADESIAYNVSQVSTLQGHINRPKLEEVFQRMITRHESLRTSFEIIGNQPVQRIHQSVKPDITYYETGVSREDDQKESLVGDLVRRFIRPFNLTKAPLARIALIDVGDASRVLVIDMHHIITDRTSMRILIQEFQLLYAGQRLPGLDIQYKDFSAWQNRVLAWYNVHKQEAFWLEQFEPGIPAFNLPLDHERPAKRSFEGNTLRFHTSREETRLIRDLASKENATLFMVLLAMFNVLLSKISGQEDIVVGTVVEGRRHAELQPIIGMFVNTLALRNSPIGQKTFTEFLKDLKKRTIEAFDNQEYPFEDLVGKVCPRRDPKRHPLFDTAFGTVDRTGPLRDEPAVENPAAPKAYEKDLKISKFDLTLEVRDEAAHLLFKMGYSTEIFEQKTIRHLIDYFKEIISSLLENNQIKLKDITISHHLKDSESPQPEIDFEF